MPSVAKAGEGLNCGICSFPSPLKETRRKYHPLPPHYRPRRQPINRRPSRSTQASQHPAMLRPNTPQRNDRHRRPMRQRRETHSPQHPPPRMGPRRKERRQENKVRPCSLGRQQLTRAVNGHAANHRPRRLPDPASMPTIRTPSRCVTRRSRPQQHEPPPPRDLRQPVVQGTPLTRPRPIMAKEYPPTPLGQTRSTRQQRLGRYALVRHQPDRG